MSVKIITDSTADMPDSGKSRILTVPMHVRFGSEEYLDGVTIDHETFYHKLIESDVLPTTSQIAPFDYEERFREAVEQGDEVVCITVSGKLSGCCQSANIAAEEFPGRVTVVDSLNVAIGQRILVELALQARDAGKGAQEIADLLNESKQHIRLIALLDTLEYLKKGGRISSAAALAGSLLAIMRVFAIKDGEVAILGKARGSKQGNNLLVQQIEKAGGVDFARPVLLGYTGQSDAQLQRYYEDSRPLWENGGLAYDPVILSGAIGTHLGPGAVGVAFFAPQ